jgi:hypothetical protein
MSEARSLILSILVLAAGCGAPSTGVRPADTPPDDGDSIRFNILEVAAESSGCSESEGRCARVTVTYPETTGGGSEIARENIDLFLRHDLVSRLRGFLPGEVGNGIGRIDGLAAAFLAQHRSFVADFPESQARWFLEIEVAPIFNTARVSTIEISESASTGGAHPNARRRLVSFDVPTGQLLGIDDLTTDIEVLTSLAERQLRDDRGVGPDEDLEAAGFWIPEGGFTLPDNFGVVSEGILFHWDAYEIAPYSVGPIDVSLKAADLHEIVGRDYWQPTSG